MKLTKSRLIEMIKQELKEFTTTSGGATSTQKADTAKKDVKTKRGDKASKKSTWDSAKTDYNTADADMTAKTSTYNTKDSARTALAGQKYRKAGKTRGSWLYRSSPGPGYSLNPAWTTADNERTTALNSKNAAKSTLTTKSNRKNSAETDYNTAASNLTAAEKANKAAKKDTNFGVSAGGGGRASGKGGTAKKVKRKLNHYIEYLVEI